MNNLIINCEHCKTTFKSKSSLDNHKNNAKYCLIIQKKKEKPLDDKLKCILCQKYLSSKRNLELHKEKCNEKNKIFKCENCNKILSSKRNFEIHKNKCEIIEKDVFKCEHCEKILSNKRNLDSHLLICVEKKDKELKNKDKELENKDKELEKKDKELENKDKEISEKDKIIIIHLKNFKTQEELYKEQLEKQEEQIKDLQNKLEKLANKAIERPTTTVTNTTTNNNLNITSSIDFDNLDIIRDAIQNRLNVNHVVDGQKGLAQFVVDTILTDEDGKLLYVCTDQSRQIFKYKNGAGEIKKDVEARKLTNYMVDAGIKKKSVEIAAEWYKEDDDVDIEKYEIMTNPQEKILNICNDNNGFRRKLASITSVV